jgi:DNA mismatch endonuclease, patch repair protein
MPNANGEWWARKLETNRLRDQRNDAALTEAGWTVVRVWEHERATQAVSRVMRALDESKCTEPVSASAARGSRL